MADEPNHVEQQITAVPESETRTEVSVRGHEFTIDEPTVRGGEDAGPTPVETMLASQAGCLNVAGNVVATDMAADVQIREIDISGELDTRKIQGESDEPRAGIRHLDVSMRIESDEDEETISEWARRTEERCPVTDNLVEETPCEISLSVR